MTRAQDNSGVTLVEMLVVLTIIVVLASMVYKATSGLGNQAQKRRQRQAFITLDSALEEYYAARDGFPVSSLLSDYSDEADWRRDNVELLYEELYAVPSARTQLLKLGPQQLDRWQGAENAVHLIYDVWGTVLSYEWTEGSAFPILISAGPDKTFATDDDVSNR
jgi:prepilin-type N-terminal cleavage/methylation domain-containing protein